MAKACGLVLQTLGDPGQGQGSSWTQCEDIDLKELEHENGLDVLLARLDKQWQYDDRVETSNIFDNFSSRFNSKLVRLSWSMSPNFIKP